MIKKIVSHKEPRHMDDFIAISILKMSNPNAIIETVHPQRVPAEYYDDKSVCLVDVGEKFQPDLMNFDHHQDINLNCSLILILKHIYGLSEISKVLKFIDIADRYGVKKASEELGVKLDPREDMLRREILLIDLNRYGAQVGEVFWNSLLMDDYSLWIRKVYTELEAKGLLDEPREKIKQEEKKYKEKVNKVEIREYGNVRVAFSAESLAPYHYRFFEETGTDLLVERNSMNSEHTSVIKNTSSEKTKNIDLSRVFEEYPKVFLHQNGFLAVLGVSFEEVDKERILKILL
ncbi:MAG: MYG1 family protein [Caldimicrobium sp.]|nr:MYG1 family protein [Caldimicrobium sp.]